MSKLNYKLFLEAMENKVITERLSVAYEKIKRDYGGVQLHQREAHIIAMIGRNSEITITELAEFFYNTPSACSQGVKRLVAKGLIKSQVNEENNRKNKLYLTDLGKQVYEFHEQFEKECYDRVFERLEGISDEEMKVFIDITKRMNKQFQEDLYINTDKE